jgi:hypothetical protein
MRRQVEEFETYHLTCPVCGALPGTTCLDEEYQELATVHPSRRMSVAERNRRRHENGWEPPELAERRTAGRAPSATLPVAGQGRAAAAIGGVRAGAWAEPARTTRGDATTTHTASRRNPRSGDRCAPQTGGGARDRILAYLAGQAEGAAVPREALRELAVDASPALGPVPISDGKWLRRKAQGLPGSSSKGSRATLRLSAHLKRLEGMGLVRRDNHRDMVIVTDPSGLRTLMTSSGAW